MDLSRLRRAEWAAAAAGAALLVVMFLDWYELRGGGGIPSVGLSAWQAFGVTDVVLALTALTALALAAVTAARRSPALPVAASVATSTLGIVATVLLLYRILNQPGPNDFVEARVGAFLGFVCTLAVAAAGWASMRDEAWEDAPVPADVRPAPPPEGPKDPAPPPEAEPRA